MELKEPLSFEKQIEKLKSHGMVMEDESKVKEILAEIIKNKKYGEVSNTFWM